MLKFLYDNESDIPPAVRANYAQDGAGKWVLQVEGAVHKSVVDQFRTNNIALTQERDTLKATFEGVDPVEYKKLKKNKDLLDENKLVTAEGLEAAVEKRTSAMKADLEGKVNDLTTKLTSATGEMGKLKIDGAVLSLGTKHGLRPEAQDDYIARAQRTFKLDPSGNVVALGADGTPAFGVNGQPLTIDEWVKTTAADTKSFGHLFLPSQGGGATGGGNRSNGSTNVFKSGNLTDQGRLLQTNQAEYNRQKAEFDASVTTV